MNKKFKKTLMICLCFIVITQGIRYGVRYGVRYYRKVQNKVELYYTDYDINEIDSIIILIGEKKEMPIDDGSSKNILINKEMEITDEEILNEFVNYLNTTELYKSSFEKVREMREEQEKVETEEKHVYLDVCDSAGETIVFIKINKNIFMEGDAQFFIDNQQQERIFNYVSAFEYIENMKVEYRYRDENWNEYIKDEETGLLIPIENNE